MLGAWRRLGVAIQSNQAPASLLFPLLQGSLAQTTSLLDASMSFTTQTTQPTTTGHTSSQLLPSLRPPTSRSLFSLPGFENETAKRYTERRLIGFSPKQMFDVVADVDNYYKFVPWCQTSTVLRRKGEEYLEAELEVGFQVFVEKYTSRVTLERPSLVRSQVGESTLFSHLDSTWRFDQGPSPSSVWLTFDIDFAFKSPLYRQVANVFFEEVVQHMIGAFEGRCVELYGKAASLETGSRSSGRAEPVSSIDR